MTITTSLVVKRSVDVTNNSPSWAHSHDHTQLMTETPGLTPFTCSTFVKYSYSSVLKSITSTFEERHYLEQTFAVLFLGKIATKISFLRFSFSRFLKKMKLHALGNMFLCFMLLGYAY